MKHYKTKEENIVQSNCPKIDWIEITKTEADIISKKNNDKIKVLIKDTDDSLKPIIEYEIKIQDEIRIMAEERITAKEIIK